MSEIAASAFDHLPSAAVVVHVRPDAGPRILTANQRFSTLVGRPADTLVGARLSDFLPQAELSRILDSGPVPGVVVDSSGASRPVMVTAAAADRESPDRVVVLLDPNGRREETERELRESAKRLEGLVDNVNALIYVKDLDGSYIWINQHYARTARVRREEIRGKTDFDLWPRENAEVYVANDRAVLAAGVPLKFEEPVAVEGEERGTWLSLKFPIFDEEDRPSAVGGISSDISDRNRAEAMIRKAKDEAERANQAKNDFLSRTSHELRTPLNSIIGFGQVLQHENLSEANAESVDHIVNAGRHLLSLINEILEISRIESGNQSVLVQPVDACAPLVEAYELVRPLAAARHIELSRDLHAALHRHVLADQQRLTQVLLNVLTNAVKYNRELGMITVTTEVLDGYLRYRVMDTGRGMSESDVEKLFTPFERLGVSGSDIEGTGLGLALSKSLVEAMGGAIGVERTVKGSGTVCYVDIPLTELAPAPVDEPSDRIQPVDASRRLTSLTVVYIEDNLANLEVVRRMFSLEGAPTLVPALQGALGVDLVIRHQPDLVLLDLHLPDIEGSEVLRRLQADPRTRGIPVLILSADATRSRIEQLIAAGAAGYLTKPLDVREFLGAVRAAVFG